ncbi:MAG: hypothetical protein HYW24_02015 [Candidatus Aenigmarchaeota archaeon]|nr:hypothetical protein [Candidatus Aenigmarchaeota archaeon]
MTLNQKEYEEFSVEYFKRTRRGILKAHNTGKGKVRVSGILGRAYAGRDEDIEIAVDSIGEIICNKLLIGKPVHVYSEHSEFGVDENIADELWALDPKDNTRLFMEGLKHMWYTVFSAYDAKTLEPKFTMIGDILNNSIRFTRGNENYELGVSRKKERKIESSKKIEIDNHFRLASYTMSMKYFIPLFERCERLFRYFQNTRTLVYANGGSNIYGDLAAGSLDAYLMVNEPREEIDPGYPIAKNAGWQIVIVGDNGEFEEYHFEPQKLKRKESVPAILATATSELRDRILPYLKVA